MNAKPVHRPGCYTREIKSKATWSIDEGRSCMNASTPHWWEQLLKAEPGCEGCARAERAKEIFWPKPMTLIQVHSSIYGTLVADATSGDVVRADFDDPEILRFNFDEWCRHYGREIPSDLDILDVGYWYKGGYEPPEEDFRQLIEDERSEHDHAPGGPGTA